MNETNPFAPQGDVNDPMSAGADATRALALADELNAWLKRDYNQRTIAGADDLLAEAADLLRRLAAAPAPGGVQGNRGAVPRTEEGV